MKDHTDQYNPIEYIKKKISKSSFYSLIHLSEEIICIYKDKILDRRSRVLVCKRFIHKLAIMVVRGSFYVGVYKYARPGSFSDWIVVLKVARGASYEIQSVIEAISGAAHIVPSA